MRIEPNAIVTMLYVPKAACLMCHMLLGCTFKGFTHWPASGGWLNPATGHMETESIIVFRVIQAAHEYNEQLWRDIAAAIRTGFDQQTVLYESTPCLMVLDERLSDDRAAFQNH